jgi:hypothetical protein
MIDLFKRGLSYRLRIEIHGSLFVQSKKKTIACHNIGLSTKTMSIYSVAILVLALACSHIPLIVVRSLPSWYHRII